jgi:hypothetical protein
MAHVLSGIDVPLVNPKGGGGAIGYLVTEVSEQVEKEERAVVI